MQKVLMEKKRAKVRVKRLSKTTKGKKKVLGCSIHFDLQTAGKVKFQLKIYSFNRMGMIFGHFNGKT